MAEVALEDDIVTDEEHAELARIASLLGLRPADVGQALEAAATRRSRVASAANAPTSDAPEGAASLRLGTVGIDLAPGDRIVFTGAMVRDRSAWEEHARELGYVPGGITKKTKLVVASDPNSQSGKAAKARSYGIPIITEAAFARLVGA